MKQLGQFLLAMYLWGQMAQAQSDTSQEVLDLTRPIVLRAEAMELKVKMSQDECFVNFPLEQRIAHFWYQMESGKHEIAVFAQREHFDLVCDAEHQKYELFRRIDLKLRQIKKGNMLG